MPNHSQEALLIRACLQQRSSYLKIFSRLLFSPEGGFHLRVPYLQVYCYYDYVQVGKLFTLFYYPKKIRQVSFTALQPSHVWLRGALFIIIHFSGPLPWKDLWSPMLCTSRAYLAQPYGRLCFWTLLSPTLHYVVQ